MKRLLNFILISAAAMTTSVQAGTLKFNGTSAYVSLDSTSVTRLRFVTTNSFSIEAWVKVNSLSAFQTIVGKYNANVYGEYYVGINTNGQVWFQREAAPNFILTSVNSVPTNIWTHVAVTYTNGTRRIYINGQVDPVVDPGSGPNPTGGPNTVLLGARQTSGAPVTLFNGELDEVRFWNTTRSTAQIQANLNRALTGDEAGLLAYYRFEDAGGLYAVDGTMSSLAGVLAGGPVWNPAFDALPRPIADSRPASLVANTSAQLNGFVNTNRVFSSNYFRWGPGSTALSFDGVDDVVTVPHQTALNPLPLSVTAWVKVPPGAAGGIVNKYVGSSLNGWRVTVANGRIHANYFRSASQFVGSATGNNLWGGRIDDDEWHHIAFTVDATGGALYVDGQVTAEGSWVGVPTAPTSTNSLGIGNGAGAFLAARIDDAAVWNIALNAAAISNLIVAGRTAGHAQYASVVAHWDMDTGAGPVLADLTGHGHNGTLSGVPIWKPEARPILTNQTARQVVSDTNFALDLDGLNDYVDAPDGVWFNGPFTIESWVYVRNYNSYSRILDFGNGPGIDNVVFALSPATNGQPFLSVVRNGIGFNMTSSERIPLNQWVHMAATLQGIQATIYMNGAVVATRTSNVPVGVLTTNNFIGRSNWAGDRNADAMFDDFRIWTVARTADQIRQGMTLPPNPADPGLRVNYRFDEPSGVTVVDSRSTAPRNGTLVNGAGRLPESRVQASLAGLRRGITYHAQLVAESTNGVSTGDIQRFATPAPGSGTALEFDGVDDYVRATAFGSNAPTTEVTVEFWQRVESLRQQSVFSLEPDVVGNRMQVHVPWADGVVYWDFGNISGAGRLTYTPPESLVGKWNHFAFVASQSGNFMQIYRNGVLERQKTGMDPREPGTFDLILGRYTLNNISYYFNGELDEFRIWNLARTQADIQRDLNERLLGSEVGLVAYYRMDESVGTLIFDASINRRHGLVADGPVHISSSAPVGIPVATTLPATLVGFGNATLNGMVNGERTLASSCWFDYSVEGGPTLTTPVQLFSATAAMATTNTIITNLQGGDIVSFRFVAGNANGTNYGATQTFVMPFTGSGYALQFDRTNYVNLGSSDALKATTALTVEAWIFPTGPGQDSADTGGIIVNKEGEYEFARFADGTLRWALAIASPSWDWVNTGIVAPTNQWMHVAFVYGNGAVKLYTNGVPARTNSASGNIGDAVPAMNELWIGARQGAPQGFQGRIDEVRIWGTVRTDFEIAANYDRLLTGSEAGLLAYLHFDEGGGTTTLDSGPNRLVGILGNPAFVLSGAPPTSPLVATLAPSPVLATSATLRGTVNPSGIPTTTYFEYGRSTGYGTPTDPDSFPGTLTTLSLSNTVTGLEPGTTYHYRMVAYNSLRTNYGPNRTFTTLVLGAGWPVSTKITDGEASAPVHVLDGLANTYVAGVFSGSAAFRAPLSSAGGATANAFVGKMSRAADWLWAVNIPASSNGFTSIKAIALDAERNVYVAGQFSGTNTFGSTQLVSNSGTNLFVAKLDTNGVNWLWARGVGGNGVVASANALAVVGNRVFVAGNFFGSANFTVTTLVSGAGSDAFVASLDSNGTWLWANNGGGTSNVFANTLLTDARTNIYVAGQYSGTVTFGSRPPLTNAGGLDVFVSRLTPGGAWALARRGGGVNNDIASALVRDADKFYLVGQFGSTAGYDGINNLYVGNVTNIFVLRLDPDLIYQDYTQGGEGSARSAAVDGLGRVYVLGDYPFPTSFGTNSLRSSGNGDVFIAQLVGKSWAWAQQIGSAGTETAGSISADSDNSVVISGTYQGTIEIGHVALSSPNNQDIFVARLDAQRVYEHNNYVVGEAIPVPVGAQDTAYGDGAIGQPTITILEKDQSDSDALNSFVWSEPEHKLFPVRQVTAIFKWPLTRDPNATSSVTAVGRARFPDHPQIHVAGAPVELEPAAGFPLKFPSLAFTTVPGANLDAGTKLFHALQPGWSVIQFLNAGDELPNPLRHPSVFEVVRTVEWNDSGHLRDNQPAIVGSALTLASTPTDPGHSDPAGKNGYVFFERAAYDGAGDDRAHNRASRSGPILPVNEDTGTNDDLVVIWYGESPATGIGWPDKPFRYTAVWPTNAEPLVLASGTGSGVLSPADFPAMRVYNQPDPALPGHNPNEEHAALYGTTLYALRNDLNAKGLASKPYVLLKYQEPGNGQWAMKVFKVVLTNAIASFTYSDEVGKELFLPPPLSLLQLCSSSNQLVSGPGFRDFQGRLYARAAGTNSSGASIVARYWYPLQPEFFYDLDGDGESEAPAGTCIPWLDRRVGGIEGQPIDITYNISWPQSSPVLQIGETLHRARPNWPDIFNFPSAQVVFDQANPDDTNAWNSLVRLFDPLTERTLDLPADFTLPPDIITANRAGRKIFTDLPYAIRARLFYDDLNKRLSFAGLLDESRNGTRENPLLLINVMSPRERDRIKDLSPDGNFVQAIEDLYDLTRNPNRLDVDRDDLADRTLLIGLTCEDCETNATTGAVRGRIVHERLGEVPKVLTAGPGTGSGFVTIAQNNDEALAGLPVRLHVIRVDGGPFRGDLKVILSDNVFDEKLTIRHGGDFGGEPQHFEFEWYYQPHNGSNPALPTVTDGEIDNLNGWTNYAEAYPGRNGFNDITFGDSTNSSLLVLADNWVICRYRGYGINGETNWSAWVGTPTGGPQFAEGWVGRVRDGLNPFEARSGDFHANETVTFASMLQQAGARYEGDIVFGDGDSINNVGLIEAYETVLRRAKRLSIEGVPPMRYQPANDALLRAGGFIADLYMLLGNEAVADAADPTIGFRTSSAGYGTLAPSIFTFQNQLDSLLEEELALLRGRDDASATVQLPPAYNRILWNFTRDEGEVAYAQAYNITDQNDDGFINAADARIMFPQGHGDAWGHYLTATKTYYSLLQNTQFDWLPRTETILLSSSTVRLNYLDERKFARAAAAKAKTGAEIVDMSYRLKYVDDPAGQYQGYKDTDPQRAWGVSEWAHRVGSAALFDWVVANAVLPATDPTNSGLSKIDRTTVVDIDEIAAGYTSVQSQVDKADAGLNPLGLAKNVVPFDIDPAQIDSGKTHFEQIYERAIEAMKNTVTVFDHANQLSQALRGLQDDVSNFSENVDQQERDYKNRLIEIFGYPYGGDIGSGKTYPAGYDGPDLYHYMYVNPVEFTGDPEALVTNSVSAKPFTAYFAPIRAGIQGLLGHYFPEDLPVGVANLSTNILQVQFPVSASDYSFSAPPEWGRRRAPGELQTALSELLQAEAQLRRAHVNHANHVKEIEEKAELLQTKHDLKAEELAVKNEVKDRVLALKAVILLTKAINKAVTKSIKASDKVVGAVVESMPKSVGTSSDVTAPLRGAAKFLNIAKNLVLNGIKFATDQAISHQEDIIKAVEKGGEAQIESIRFSFEIQQEVKGIEKLLREEQGFRLEMLAQAQKLDQVAGNYEAALAKGLRLVDERIAFRKNAAAETQASRYQDMTFRIFRNDAIQKYRAQFDVAAKYVFLAAVAYDYETQLLGDRSGAGRAFLTDIVRQRALGEVINGMPVAGRHGLADPLARLNQNFGVLKGQLGFNNPQTETDRFSLRNELLRLRDDDTSDQQWRAELKKRLVPNLWDVPEFRRYCRPFAPESAGPQPGLVIRFPTTINFGFNYFGWPLGGGDSAYDPTLFATKVRSAGVWFSDYSGNDLSFTPRVYLVPAGADIMRSPSGNNLEIREWRVVDQKIPVPFPIGFASLNNPAWIPINDSLSDTFADVRRFSSFRAHHDTGSFVTHEAITDSRLIGRSVWNTDWMLIIPGGTFLFDADQGLEKFIDSVSDIKIFFQTYAYSGN